MPFCGPFQSPCFLSMLAPASRGGNPGARDAGPRRRLEGLNGRDVAPFSHDPHLRASHAIFTKRIRRLPYLKRRVTGRFPRSPRQPQRWLGVSVPTGPRVRVARTPDIVVSPASARMPLSMPVESEMGYRRRSGNRQTPPRPVLLEPQTGVYLGANRPFCAHKGWVCLAQVLIGTGEEKFCGSGFFPKNDGDLCAQTGMFNRSKRRSRRTEFPKPSVCSVTSC